MHRPMTRRMLAAMIPTAFAVRPAAARQTPTSFDGQVIRVLTFTHPATGYTDQLRRTVEGWGNANNARVMLETVDPQYMDDLIDGNIRRNALHDVVIARSPMVDRYDRFDDLADLANQAQSTFGPPITLADSAAVFNGKRGAICTGFEPAPMQFRRSVWETYRLPGGPPTWESLVTISPAIIRDTGMYPGIGFAPEPGSERLADSLVRAYGGSVMDASGKVTLDSPQTIEAVRVAMRLYGDVLTPEALSFKEERPSGLLANNIASIINDGLTAMRQATAMDPDIGADVFVVGPPGGPDANTTGSIAPVRLHSWHITSTSPVKDAARALLLHVISTSSDLVQASQLAQHPTYPSLVPDVLKQDGWLDVDPFGARPPDKLRYLKSAMAWTCAYGGADFTHPALAWAQRTYALSAMFRAAIQGTVPPEQAVADAAAAIAKHR